MKLTTQIPIPLVIAGLLWVGNLPAAPEPDPVAAIKKATDELTAADKADAAAYTALLAAREALDNLKFGTAAYNARISAQQLATAKEKYEKAAPEAKNDTLEAYELTQEIDAQRKTAHETAQKLLPQREAESQTAAGKYAAALAAANSAAEQIKALVRQSESDVQAKLKDSKLAIEKAAFTKANAEQAAATNAAIVKTMSELAPAEKAIVQAAAVLKQAPEQDRAKKLADAEKAVKAYLAALHTVAQQLPDKIKATPLAALSTALIDADEALKKATAEQQRAKQSLDETTKAVQQTEERIRNGREELTKRIAKIRGQKDLDREQESLKRAQTAKAEAERALPTKTAAAEKAQKDYAAALENGMKELVLAPEPEKAAAPDKAAFAKAIADHEAELKKQNEAATREAADAEKASGKARAELAATEKVTSQRSAARDALAKVMRQRFVRDARIAHDGHLKVSGELAAATRDVQTKTNAVTKATDGQKQAGDAVAKVQKDAAAQGVVVANVAKEQQASESALQQKVAARLAAEKKSTEAEAALKSAREVLANATEETRAEAEKGSKQAEAQAQAAANSLRTAADAAKTAQAARDKSSTALKAAEKRAADLASALKTAEQKRATAQAALDKASGDKAAAEKEAARLRPLVEEALAKLDLARTGMQGGLKPLPLSAWTLEKARHLIVRAGFGGTPEEVAKLHAMGLHGAVDHLVNFQTQPAADAPFAAYPKEKGELYESALTGEEQRRLRQARAEHDRQQLLAMRRWWLQRMIESPRPLEEKLTLFWHGQIPVQFTTVGDSYYMYLQNELFRSNAAGNFATLLHGIAHDAAMLKYLNNDTNVKGRANENLAREIMELFSMGRDQGYTEVDIKQGARALTGYTYDAATGQFRYISDRHDNEPKTIFGRSGNYSGDDFVTLILDTPAPAKFIARQLFSFFAHSDPSLDTVESLATVLRVNNYEIAPMLENLFLSEEFYSARTMSTEIKSPVELIVGLHRDLGLKNPDYAYLAGALQNMGQDLFEPPSVFGWQPGRSWITTSRILGRYNVLAEVLEKRPRAGKTGVDVVGTILAGQTFKTHAEVVDYLAKCVWVVTLPETKRQTLIEFLKPLPEPAQWSANPGAANTRLTRLLMMLMCSPEAQLG